MATEFIYRKNPLFGQSSQAEMLAAETVARPDPPTAPKVMSKTQFQDYVVSQLGGGTVGMSRFIDIMEATAASSVKAARFAYKRYEAATVIEKANVEQLTGIMTSITEDGKLTSAERDTVLANWPEV